MLTLSDAMRKAAPKPAAKVLRNLKIDDVSSVDIGAGRGVRVVLHKRHTVAGVMEAVTKALKEVHNGEVDFHDVRRGVEDEGIQKAIIALEASINSILRDDDVAVADKSTYIAKSVVQFHRYISTLGPEEVPARQDGGTVKKEVSVSGKKAMRCPSCGAEHDEDAFAKAASAPHVAIGKAQTQVFDSIIKKLMDGGMSKQEAVATVGKGAGVGSHVNEMTALSDAVRAEREMKLGPGYRF